MWFLKKKTAIDKHNDRQLDRLSRQVSELQDEAETKEKYIDNLSTEKRALVEEVENLKLKKKIEEEDVEHLVKMKLERADLDADRKIMEAEQAADKKVVEAEKQFNDELKKYLEKAIDQGEDRYKEILSKLADVKVNLGHEPKG